MLDQLLKIVEQNAQQQIVENKSIPDQFNNAAIKEVTNQILNNLKGQVSQGNMQQVVTMFRAGNARTMNSNPVVTTIVSSVADSLVAKFNLPSAVAQSVANGLVPSVLNEIIRKSNDPRDIDFDLQQMMRSMSGNSTLDISGMVGPAPKTGIGSIGDVFGKLFGK